MLMLIDLPEPVHGMSNINKSILSEVRKRRLDSKVINTVPSYAYFIFGTKFWALAKLLHSFICVIRLIVVLAFLHEKIVYRPVMGGSGQIFDFVYLLLCRLFKCKVVIHHHSFNYLDKKSELFSLIVSISSPDTIHVVLGNKMKIMLSELYDIESSNVIELSNIVFFDSSSSPLSGENNNCLVLGHLSNLSYEKGIEEFMLLCESLIKEDIEFNAQVAGPFTEPKVEELVLSYCDKYKNISYLGALYGEQKENYFKEIDIFVFPSKYKNEAEPLVLYEAGQFGVLNIGTKQGCMEDVLRELKGESYPSSNEVVENMVYAIKSKIEHNAMCFEEKEKRVNAFKIKKENAFSSLDIIMKILGNKDVSESH